VIERYAAAITELMDDEPRRAQMGKKGRLRVEQELAWSHQQGAYVGVFQELVSGHAASDRNGT
jgi:glycosyltransferase involved in cell wall biosynthesis